ncbi:MAG: LamB/YcsF family protein [Candidatus Bathyarchaeia archaeon]|nr:LamB/YcsF family protein [Candidatus Bathyarchaeota archaeon A05DMB-4]MDH7594879.1 5-oxoprolinase subunit PxpA [Candidatus Bathyarchaeota archaeon]
MRQKVDINCDLGESYGHYKIGYDEQIMPHITSANIACGFHAGDPNIMAQTVTLAKKYKTAIGAHPGFPDIQGFGRREMKLSSEEVRNLVVYQIGALQAFTKASGMPLQHVKPHGALYNMAMKDALLAKAVVGGVEAVDSKLIVFTQTKSEMAKVAAKAGLRVAFEVFADRAYNSDGSLVSRAMAGSVIEDPKTVTKRAIEMVKERHVVAVDGKTIDLGEVDTICVHGDNLKAVALVRALRKGLEKAGITVTAVGKFV